MGYHCSFFFFQAEDGIRDRNVTGVKTCALPISSRAQIAVFSTARWLPTVHRSKASPRANERSAALIDGDAFASGTAPSGSGSSSGLIRKTPSLVRTPAKRPRWNAKTAEGA